MALSSREQKILCDIERDLTAEDPRLAASLSHHDARARYVRLVSGGLLTLGCSVIMMAIALGIGSLLLGGGAFMLSVAGAYVTAIPIPTLRRRHGPLHEHSDSHLESS